MVAIALDVGNRVAAMDAPSLQSIICKILDLTHLLCLHRPLGWFTA